MCSPEKPSQPNPPDQKGVDQEKTHAVWFPYPQSLAIYRQTIPSCERRPYVLQPEKIVATANAADTIDQCEIAAALERHFCGDWGDVSLEDKAENDASVKSDGLVLSVHHTLEGVEFWIITDAGHELTTVLMPEDY